MKIIYSPPEGRPAPRKAEVETDALVRHKCGGPDMYILKRIGNPDDGLHDCLYWNAVAGVFQRDMFSPDELVAVDDWAR